MKKFATLLAVITVSTMALAQEKTPINKNEFPPAKTEQQPARTDQQPVRTGQQQDSVRYACTMHPEMSMNAPGKCSICNMPLEKTTATRGNSNTGGNTKSPKMEGAKSYICQTHSEIKSDKPGKCSQCGMDLVIEEKIK